MTFNYVTNGEGPKSNSSFQKDTLKNKIDAKLKTINMSWLIAKKFLKS